MCRKERKKRRCGRFPSAACLSTASTILISPNHHGISTSQIHSHKEAALLATLSPESPHKHAGKRCHYHRVGFGSMENANSPKSTAVDVDIRWEFNSGCHHEAPSGQERGSPCNTLRGLRIGNARRTKTYLLLHFELLRIDILQSIHGVWRRELEWQSRQEKIQHKQASIWKSERILSKTAQMFNDPLLLTLLKSIHRITESLRGQQSTKGTSIPYACCPLYPVSNVHKASDSQLHTLPTTLLFFLSEA